MRDESQDNGRCAFCPNKKLTGEHLWSAWISRLLSTRTTGYNFNRRHTASTFRNRSLWADQAHEWQQPTLDQKTNVVCAACNNGWMSQLEHEAATLLSNVIRDDARLSLLPRGVMSLATCAFKNAVVGSCMIER